MDSPAIVADVAAAAPVAGLAGEVRVEPQPYAVLQDNGALKADDLFFSWNISEKVM